MFGRIVLRVETFGFESVDVPMWVQALAICHGGRSDLPYMYESHVSLSLKVEGRLLWQSGLVVDVVMGCHARH